MSNYKKRKSGRKYPSQSFFPSQSQFQFKSNKVGWQRQQASDEMLVADQGQHGGGSLYETMYLKTDPSPPYFDERHASPLWYNTNTSFEGSGSGHGAQQYRSKTVGSVADPNNSELILEAQLNNSERMEPPEF